MRQNHVKSSHLIVNKLFFFQLLAVDSGDIEGKRLIELEPVAKRFILAKFVVGDGDELDIIRSIIRNSVLHTTMETIHVRIQPNTTYMFMIMPDHACS